MNEVFSLKMITKAKRRSVRNNQRKRRYCTDVLHFWLAYTFLQSPGGGEFCCTRLTTWSQPRREKAAMDSSVSIRA